MSSLSPGIPFSHDFDVLCVGHASYDLVFAVDHHPAEDEKIFADQLIACGGGPAANAAVTVARLGGTSAYMGYLGQDLYGDAHLAELHREGVDTRFVARGTRPTPLSAVLVKPDGSRALVNYKGASVPLNETSVDVTAIRPRVVLLDGHEPLLSVRLADWARGSGLPVVVDAGSLHEGTLALMGKVDYLVCSEKFARQYGGVDDARAALSGLASKAPVVVITLGDSGLVWQRGAEAGSLPAFGVECLDSTGAGDTFHGAFALALARRYEWRDMLRFASAAGALCCEKLGARIGIPRVDEVKALLEVGETA